MPAVIYGALLRTLEKQHPYQGKQAASRASEWPKMRWDGKRREDGVQGTAETGSPRQNPSYLLSTSCLSAQLTQFPRLVPLLLLLAMASEDSGKMQNTP